MSRRRLLLTLPVLLASPGALPAQSSPERAAIVVESGTTVRSQVVAVGRDLEVHGHAMSNAAAIGGEVTVSGRVDGDLVAVGGDVILRGSARIDGDVFVLGGTVRDEGGGSVVGREVALPDVSPSWLVLAEGPALGLSPFSRAVVGVKLALLASWMVVAMVLLASAAPAVASTSRAVAEEPLRCFAVGFVGVLALLMLTLLFGSTLDALLGVPLVVLCLLGALVLKLWGVVAVFCWLGGVLSRRASRHWTFAARDTIVGLLALGALKLVPYVGVWVWTAATLVGMGAALATKFGRREPWIEGATAAVSS